MKFPFCILVYVFVAIDNVQNHPVDSNNNSTGSLVQSTYAKVTKWGASPSVAAINEGRSNNGQTLFSQRSDVNIINGQNLKKPETTYHYSMLKNNRSSTLSRADHRSQEKLLTGRGEIQAEKRYNPKPYFDYSPIPSKENKMPQRDKGTGTGDGPPLVVYGTPFDSFPSFPKPIAPPKTTVGIKPSINLYNSPYDSYNPPAPNVDAKPAPGPIYPPNDMPPSVPTYLSPSNTYLPSKQQQKLLAVPAMSTMMIKPSGMSIENIDNYHGPYAPPTGGDAVQLPKDHDDNHGDHHHHHDNGDDGESENGPPIVKTVDAPMEAEQLYYEHPPKGYYHHHHHQQDVDMAEMMSSGGDDDMSPPLAPSMVDMEDHHHGNHAAASVAADDGSSDLSPPPNGGSDASGGNNMPIMPKLPGYMNHEPTTNGAGNYHGYQFDHHHNYEDHPPIHHVYHEVHTTTTTEAPEDERVNKGHYSYYYLGRKLWYIPLYFSVYFILYITALILKSIARHKVNLVHEYPKDKGRSYDSAGHLDIDDIQRKVARAVDDGAQKYAM